METQRERSVHLHRRVENHSGVLPKLLRDRVIGSSRFVKRAVQSAYAPAYRLILCKAKAMLNAIERQLLLVLPATN